MIPTLFGGIVVAIGGWLLVRGSTLSMLLFVMWTTLLGGSAAILMPMLGGSSIPPAVLALLFLIARCLLPGDARAGSLREAARANALLALFAVYGAAGAFLLPFVFEDAISVTPLRPIKSHDPFVTFPLAFSNQNITSAVYLVATMLGSICAYDAVARGGRHVAIARAAAGIGIVHALIGFGSVAAAGTSAAAVFEYFRNGSHMELNQSVESLVRMSGIHPEASGYAIFGFGWFVFAAELWIRNVERRWTGPAAFLLFAALMLSTASTAYIGIAAYAAILGVRIMVFPATISAGRLVGLAGFGIALIVVALLVAAFRPDLAATAVEVLMRMTLEKGQTLSGMQRLSWAKQGVAAFAESGGLGIGVGSFRSSSLATAILGSVGLIGSAAFLAHLLRVLMPLRQSSYVRNADAATNTGAAASWTAVVMLIPACFTASSPDPGLSFAMIGGAALALRRARAARPRRSVSAALQFGNA